MISPVFFTAPTQGKYHFAFINPNHPFPKGILSHSFPLSFSLPFPSHKPLPPRPSSLKLSSPSSDSTSTSSLSTVDSSDDTDELAEDLSPVLKVYKDGRIERLAGVEIVPPGIDPVTDVESKDVVISIDEAISARVFLPKITNPDQKLPVLVYFHGGAFCIETPFSPNYHNYLKSVTFRANLMASPSITAGRRNTRFPPAMKIHGLR